MIAATTDRRQPPNRLDHWEGVVTRQLTPGLGAVLAMIAGYVDAYGYITYRTFVSFMSGNTTVAGIRLGEGHWSAALPPLVAIVAFVTGGVIGSAFRHAREHQARRIEFAAVAVIWIVVIVITSAGLFTNIFRTAAMSLAMGILNLTVARVGEESISVTLVTGTLSKIGSHLGLALRRAPVLSEASASSHGLRAVQLARIWSTFLIGAILAAVATPRLAAWTLALPAAILLLLALLDNARIRDDSLR
jgi:uncharacterized membrane protein YoaK (UPF0700 family)